MHFLIFYYAFSATCNSPKSNHCSGLGSSRVKFCSLSWSGCCDHVSPCGFQVNAHINIDTRAQTMQGVAFPLTSEAQDELVRFQNKQCTYVQLVSAKTYLCHHHTAVDTRYHGCHSSSFYYHIYICHYWGSILLRPYNTRQHITTQHIWHNIQ